MTSTTAALAALVLAAAAQDAPASPTPAPQTPAPATALPDVVIDGRSAEQYVRDFVADVMAPARGWSVARWRGSLCVGVANLQPEPAQFMVDRVSEVALALGADPGEPGCNPSVVVLFTEDGRALATGLVEADRQAFHLGVGGMDRGKVALEAFKNAEAPVRWWHVSLPADRDTNTRAIRLPGDDGPPMIRTLGGRLNTEIESYLNKVIIIVDVTRLGDTSFVQLTDYVALIAMAQIDPDADTAAYDTVLNVFDAPNSAPGLTEWDWAYLEALYSNRSRRANPGAFNGAVADIMIHDRRREARAAEAAQRAD